MALTPSDLEKDPHQVSYPATTVEIVEHGLLLTIHFAPSLSMTQAIGADAMNAIVESWTSAHAPAPTIQDRIARIERRKARTH